MLRSVAVAGSEVAVVVAVVAAATTWLFVSVSVPAAAVTLRSNLVKRHLVAAVAVVRVSIANSIGLGKCWR